MFQKIVLAANAAKSNNMTCQPGDIQSGKLEEAFGRIITGEGATYQERLRIRVPYLDYGVEIMSGYLTYQLRRLHGIKLDIDWERIIVSQH